MTEINKKDICFLLLPGFAPDAIPVLGIKAHLEEMGYNAVATNFWGNFLLQDFSKLTIENCKEGIAKQIDELSAQYTHVIGIGVSLGGALLLEYAKENNKLHCIISIGTPFELKQKFLIKVGFALYPIFLWRWKFLQRFKSQRPIPLPAAPMVARYLTGDFLKNMENGYEKSQKTNKT